MKNVMSIICYLILVFGCSKSEDLILQNPTAAKLVFPYENSLCNEGTDITDSQSRVLFEWKSSNHTDSYTLVLKNLFTNSEKTYKTTDIEFSVVIDRATPYWWYVISESNSVLETAQSDIWQFYNAGEGIQSYAPFPAQIESPYMAEEILGASEITLKWNGIDIDNDIANYDVYFGTESVPGIYLSNLVDSELKVPILSNTIYYWRIVTKDKIGNTSDSGIYQFRNL